MAKNIINAHHNYSNSFSCPEDSLHFCHILENTKIEIFLSPAQEDSTPNLTSVFLPHEMVNFMCQLGTGVPRLNIISGSVCQDVSR